MTSSEKDVYNAYRNEPTQRLNTTENYLKFTINTETIVGVNFHGSNEIS